MLPSSVANSSERFGQYFHVAPALDEVTKSEAHFIRHDVYARELGFEPVRADQRETDRYDGHSLQCVIRTADAARRPVGCARLVLTDPADRDAPLPFEIACRSSLDRSVMDPAKLPRERMAEVSRLAVMGDFRRRKDEGHRAISMSVADSGGLGGVHRFPHIPLSLYFAAVALARRQGIDYIFTLTEPRLARHFALSGLTVQAIGAPIDHRGLRVPSVIRVADVYPSLRAMMRPIWQAVHAQIDAAYLVHNAQQKAYAVALSAQPASVH